MSELEEFINFLKINIGNDYYDDFFERGFSAVIRYVQACAEKNKVVIDRQAEEIAALRRATKEVIHYTKRYGDGGLVYSGSILSIFKQPGILDESAILQAFDW